MTVNLVDLAQPNPVIIDTMSDEFRDLMQQIGNRVSAVKPPQFYPPGQHDSTLDPFYIEANGSYDEMTYEFLQEIRVDEGWNTEEHNEYLTMMAGTFVWRRAMREEESPFAAGLFAAAEDLEIIEFPKNITVMFHCWW